jgi:hypothetical protein
MSNRPPMTERFLRFHRENPTVYGQIVSFTREAAQTVERGSYERAVQLLAGIRSQ